MFLDKFLEQVRPYRKTGPGKNNLRHDDVADVVGYATDPALDEIAPQATSYEIDEDYDDAEWRDATPYGRYI